MAEAKLIDYYSILNLPSKADLAGIENAYARLSDELAVRLDVDETSGVALRRLNEAYSVLSRPELRREYDKVFFNHERSVEAEKVVTRARRRDFARRTLISALAIVVLVQALTLAYVGREQVADFVSVAVGPLTPGDAQ